MVVAVLSLPLWAQMVVPTVPAGGGAGSFNPASITGLYCLLTGCEINPGPFIVNGEFEVNNNLISACGGVGPCTAGPAYQDRVGINTATPATELDVNGSVTIGSLFTVFDSVNNTIGVNVAPGTDSTIPLLLRGGIQINNTPTACGATQEGSLQSTLVGSLQYCNGDDWITAVSFDQNTGIAPFVDLAMEVANLECNGAFGDCVDGDEVNAIRDIATGNLGTCTKNAPGTGMIFRNPCALNQSPERIQAGGASCIEMQFNRTANFFNCSAALPPFPRYSVCGVFLPYQWTDAKGAAAVNWAAIPGLGGAGVEAGFYQADNLYPMAVTARGIPAGGGGEVSGLLPSQLGGPLVIACATVMDTGGVNPSGLEAVAGGWSGQAGLPTTGVGTIPVGVNIGGAGTGAAGTQDLWRGRFLAWYMYDQALQPDPQLQTLINYLQLKFRSYY